MIRRLFGLKKPAGACGLLLALILIFAFAGSALASSLVPPHHFEGQVTVGGEAAPQGIEVVAKIDNVQFASTFTDAQGKYSLDVPVDDPNTSAKDGGRDGDIVKFYVAGVLGGSYIFETGGITELNLTIDALPDTVAPTVEGTDPQDKAADVPVNAVIAVTFSETVVQGDSFGQIALKDAAGTTMDCDVTLDGKVLTIDPKENLAYSTTYTVVIPAGSVKDAAGNALLAEYAFSFTTEVEPVTLQELKVEPGSVTLTVGETKELVVKAVYSDGTEADVTDEATYASANESVATVSGSGLVTAGAAGETVVTVVYGDKSARIPVVVTDTEVAPQKYTVTFTVTDQDQKPIQGAEIAIQGVEGTLVTDANGQATIDLAAGDYSYTVTAQGYEAYEGTFTVVDQAVAVEVVLTPAAAPARIINFGFRDVPWQSFGDFDRNRITALVPPGADLTSLVPEFVLFEGATLLYGGREYQPNEYGQVAIETGVDFTKPQTFTVKAPDGTTQDWIVTVLPVWISASPSWVIGDANFERTFTLRLEGEGLDFAEGLSTNHVVLEGDFYQLSVEEVNRVSSREAKVRIRGPVRLEDMDYFGVIRILAGGLESGNVWVPEIRVPVRVFPNQPLFTVSGSLNREEGIRATVSVTPKDWIPGAAVVVFQLMKNDDEPVSIVALETKGWLRFQAETFIAHFNVTGNEYEVKVFVLDEFTSNLGYAPVSAAEPLTLR